MPPVDSSKHHCYVWIGKVCNHGSPYDVDVLRAFKNTDNREEQDEIYKTSIRRIASIVGEIFGCLGYEDTWIYSFSYLIEF